MGAEAELRLVVVVVGPAVVANCLSVLTVHQAQAAQAALFLG